MYTLSSAPVGLLFVIGMLAGLVIGIINCYQVLYNEVSDHLPQYATLKAVGFANSFLHRVILGQAVVLAATGFAGGAVFSFVADRYIAAHSMLPVHISLPSSFVVGVMTLVMCIAAGWIAVKRAALADPAALY
jgi:putative ABC transport system permease protein